MRFLCLIFLTWALTKALVVAELSELRVLTYNIHHAKGTDKMMDYERLAKVIGGMNPDIVALQEVDRETTRSAS